MVRLDECTKILTKGRYARVAVKIDLAKPLIPDTDIMLDGLDVSSFWQLFQYENIHLYCQSCGRVGHRAPICSFTRPPSSSMAFPTADPGCFVAHSPSPSVAPPTGESSSEIEIGEASPDVEMAKGLRMPPSWPMIT